MIVIGIIIMVMICSFIKVLKNKRECSRQTGPIGFAERLSPVHTGNNVEATVDNGNNFERVFREILSP